MRLPETPPPLGFAGDADQMIPTPEVALRLGYQSMRTFYNSHAGRRDQGFPAPIRRGIYRLGDLQNWAARKNAGAPTSGAPAAPPVFPPSNEGEKTGGPRDAIAERIRKMMEEQRP